MIMGLAQRVARKAGWTEQQIDDLMKEAMSSDYDHLLRTMMEHFDVK